MNERKETTSLSHEEILRYSRQIVLPEVTMEGQERLKRGSVLIVGAGGLGSPIALYLAAGGVGRIGLVEFDRVDRSNLQRQVLYGTDDVEKPKLHAAAKRIGETNPHVELELHREPLTSANAMEILTRYDVIADGTDNFPTRYLVNDACVLLGKPNVYGSIFRFQGQASLFDAARGPCYRCLYPEPPPPGAVPSCAEGGVLGVLPGLIGMIQATETMKLLLGLGSSLVGRLLHYDALRMTFRELALRKDPGCPVCGENRTIRDLVDYEQICGFPAGPDEEETDDQVRRAAAELLEMSGRDRAAVENTDISAVGRIGPIDLKRRIDGGDELVLLDVRTEPERLIAKIEGSLPIPLAELPRRIDELDEEKEIVCICRTGVRSLRAAFFLACAGFRRTANLEGGVHGWSDDVDRSMPKY